MDENDETYLDAVHNIERSIPMERNNSKNGTREVRGGTATAVPSGAAKNVPVHTVRVGSVKVAVWKNSTTNGPMYNSTLVRSYKNQQGEWSESQSLSRDDLLVAAKALDLAHTYIVEAEASTRAQQSDDVD